MFDIRTLLVLIPALPLLAAVLTAALGPKVLRAQGHWLAVIGIVGSFLCSFLLALQVLGHVGEKEQIGFSEEYSIWQWLDISDAMSEAPLGATGTHANELAATPDAFDLEIGVTLRADGLTAIMLLMVTFISSLVTIYACGYMQEDRGYWRFFSYVALFVFSMVMLVSVSNFVLLFVFWEAVGVCSYLLIGFWYEKPVAAAAGKKAFLVNRIGDIGFILGIFLLWIHYGTLNFHDTDMAAGILGNQRLSGQVAFVGGGVATVICLLLLLGACGKSAQFPLHVWLPDAMEGPTPVSALIHAATMVTAGIYMVARCTPLFYASPDAQLAVALVGGITALLAALIALTQTDLKRVLAYSTISQLGYMFLALGTGTLAGITAGMFHLFTHAFFKALLFLGSGSVMHAMGNVIDMRRFSGLRRIMPVTHATFAIGCLALAGVFPFAGFWSKDAIVGAVHDRMDAAEHSAGEHGSQADAGGTLYHAVSFSSAISSDATSPYDANALISTATASRVYGVLYYLALATAFLTAFYTFRAFFMTFYGPEKVPYEAGGHAHESPRSMCWPLCILAVFAVVIGGVLELTHSFSSWLLKAPSLAFAEIQATQHPGHFHMNVAVISTLLAILGIGLAAFLYLGDRREVEWLTYIMSFRWLNRFADLTWARRLTSWGPVATVRRISNSIGLGWLTSLWGYAILILICLLAVPALLFYYLSPYRLSSQRFFFDEIYNVLFVWPLRLAAAISYAVDRWIIDGFVNLCGWIPRAIGNALRRLQGGLISFYGLAMVLGLLTYMVARNLWGAH